MNQIWRVTYKIFYVDLDIQEERSLTFKNEREAYSFSIEIKEVMMPFYKTARLGWCIVEPMLKVIEGGKVDGTNTI